MSVLVTGSIGIDTVNTPLGKSENCIGGSAVYFSMAASFFDEVRFVGVVGQDCPFDLAKVFSGRNVDLRGLERRSGSRTFRWQGTYMGDMSQAITDHVEFNVLAERPPIVPEAFRDSRYVFLANTNPALQIQLLDQMHNPVFVAADTMNCWISNHGEELKKLMQRINAFICNDGEARQITHRENLAAAGKELLNLGPRVVIIKRGEHGSTMFSKDGDIFMLPAYPTDEVKDPTGAGDAFAGAVLGYLSSVDKNTGMSLRTAMAYGTVAASFAIEGFSLSGVSKIGRGDIDARFEHLRRYTQF